MSEIMRLEPKAANNCFGCGGANESGMKLTFDLHVDERKTRGKFVLGSRYGGGAGFAHGGIIALLLDEAMGKISKLTEELAVTAELSVEYRAVRPLAHPMRLPFKNVPRLACFRFCIASPGTAFISSSLRCDG